MKNIYKRKYCSNNDLSLIKNPRIKIMAKITNNLSLKNKKILDIGCYDGTFLSLINNENELYGIEASDYGCNKSKKRGINVLQFFFNDEDRISFNDNFFDLIIAGEIIEHIYDTDFFLEEIYRLLKPGGCFLISTPNIASLGRRLMLLVGIAPILEISPNRSDSSGHIRYFTFKTLENFLQEHKFKLIDTKSDIVNFSNDGKFRSYFLAKIFPGIGQSLILLTNK
jgi:2-polyprenyl-3-methyl-5-hydroxy-6-metoxy-1,4-benzoquinol methylase